jgi:hypothetical protein
MAHARHINREIIVRGGQQSRHKDDHSLQGSRSEFCCPFIPSNLGQEPYPISDENQPIHKQQLPTLAPRKIFHRAPQQSLHSTP